MDREDHPAVRWYREQTEKGLPSAPATLESSYFKKLCIDAGADDVGLVEIDRPALSDQRADLLSVLPDTRTVVGLAFRLNRDAVRAVEHSLVNLEFRQVWDHANRVGRRIVTELQKSGVTALNMPAGFPFEVDRWPGKMWLTSDKIIAEQSGLGQMGWNRLVLHPKFGALTVLGTVLVAAQVGQYDAPLSYGPCIDCKLCVAVCPVGAIGADRSFSFVSCYTHNYRERLGGFANWVEQIVASKSVHAYRQRVSDAETVSMWQNLSIGGQTRCDRCVSVCPAGTENIGAYLSDRKGYGERVLKLFREKRETVYVLPGSDAEAYVQARFPHKTVKRVSNGIRPPSASAFLQAIPLVFQRTPSKGLDATVHFTFTGDEQVEGTVVIRDQTLSVQEGLAGRPDLHVTADSRTWTSALAGETNMLWALATRKVRVKGPLALFKAFARCFPS